MKFFKFIYWASWSWLIKYLSFDDQLLLLLILVDGSAGFGGLGVTCLPRDSRFAGSNPGEIDRFFKM